MTRYTSFAGFIFSAISLIIPSGFSVGAARLLIGSLALFKQDATVQLNTPDKILIPVLLFYFLIFVTLKLLHGEGIKEFDLPLRFLLAVPALLLLRAYPPHPSITGPGSLSAVF